MFRSNFPHFKVERWGMSNVIYVQYHIEIQDIFKHNSIIQRIVK